MERSGTVEMIEVVVRALAFGAFLFCIVFFLSAGCGDNAPAECPAGTMSFKCDPWSTQAQCWEESTGKRLAGCEIEGVTCIESCLQ